MSVRVAVSSASFAKSPVLMEELRGLGVTIHANDRGKVLQPAELLAFLAESAAQVAIVGTECIGDQELAAAPELKLVAKYGVGLDNIDLAALKRRGVSLGWTGGVNRRSVSELVLAFALGHFHRVFLGVDRMRRGEWVKDGGVQLSDLCVGIVGLGHVGTDLATLLRAFGSRIIYTDIADRTEVAQSLGLEARSYEELLAEADLISLHVPATPETQGMFGARQLSLVRPSALLVNTARGSVVDFDVVCAGVKEGRLGGYAADVFPVEPCALEEFADCDNLYFTPHIGGNTREAVLAMGRSAIEAVAHFLAGQVGKSLPEGGL